VAFEKLTVVEEPESPLQYVVHRPNIHHATMLPKLPRR
jgi:hypothetical protein